MAQKNKDESSEPELVKEVGNPLNLADKSPKELEELQSQIESQKTENHLKREEKRIKAIECPVCGRKLKLKPKRYMQTGNTPEELECPGCEKLLRVFINYKENPETSTADITVKSGGYAWETKVPGEWDDKHVKRWAEEEMARIKENRSALSIEEQKIFRLLYLAVKKQKIVK